MFFDAIEIPKLLFYAKSLGSEYSLALSIFYQSRRQSYKHIACDWIDINMWLLCIYILEVCLYLMHLFVTARTRDEFRHKLVGQLLIPLVVFWLLWWILYRNVLLWCTLLMFEAHFVFALLCMLEHYQTHKSLTTRTVLIYGLGFRSTVEMSKCSKRPEVNVIMRISLGFAGDFDCSATKVKIKAMLIIHKRFTIYCCYLFMYTYITFTFCNLLFRFS